MRPQSFVRIIRPLPARALQVASVLLGVLAGSLALWDPLEIDERTHVQRITSHAVESVRAVIAADIDSRLRAEARLAELWATEETPSIAAWEPSARMLLDDYPSDFFLQFIDANYEERAFFGRQGTNPRSNLSADPRIQSVLDSFTLAARDPVLSRPIHLADGGTAIAVVAPVFRGSVLTGFAIALVDVERALSETLAALGYIGYSVSVEENSEIIYRTPRAAREYDETWAQSADLELPGLRWNIRVWPDPETLSAIRSPLPELAL